MPNKDLDPDRIVVEIKPPMWSYGIDSPIWNNGNKFEVDIYKSGHLLLVQPEVLVGFQTEFILLPSLCFAIINKGRQVGKVFPASMSSGCMTKFYLGNYPNGLKVTLNEKPGSGELCFSGTSM